MPMLQNRLPSLLQSNKVLAPVQCLPFTHWCMWLKTGPISGVITYPSVVTMAGLGIINETVLNTSRSGWFCQHGSTWWFVPPTSNTLRFNRSDKNAMTDRGQEPLFSIRRLVCYFERDVILRSAHLHTACELSFYPVGTKFFSNATRILFKRLRLCRLFIAVLRMFTSSDLV